MGGLGGGGVEGAVVELHDGAAPVCTRHKLVLADGRVMVCVVVVMMVVVSMTMMIIIVTSSA